MEKMATVAVCLLIPMLLVQLHKAVAAPISPPEPVPQQDRVAVVFEHNYNGGSDEDGILFHFETDAILAAMPGEKIWPLLERVILKKGAVKAKLEAEGIFLPQEGGVRLEFQEWNQTKPPPGVKTALHKKVGEDLDVGVAPNAPHMMYFADGQATIFPIVSKAPPTGKTVVVTPDSEYMPFRHSTKGILSFITSEPHAPNWSISPLMAFFRLERDMDVSVVNQHRPAEPHNSVVFCVVCKAVYAKQNGRDAKEIDEN